MSSILLKQTVLRVDGKLSFREEHGWPSLDDALFSEISKRLRQAAEHALKLQGTGGDSENLTVTTTVTVDSPVVQVKRKK